MDHHVKVLDLGLTDYEKAWDFQTNIHQKLIDAKKNAGPKFVGHHLILCQHPHVFTLGKSGKEEHLKISKSDLPNIQADYYKINRGGDITYHGPGQLVAYPILDLEQLKPDVHWYVRNLEETIIQTLKEFKISGDRIKEHTGVWLDVRSQNARKIAAIGVHLSRWVSLHGIAFNINTNLDYFNFIVPCGIDATNLSVTSMSKELGYILDFDEVKNIFINKFQEVFNLKLA